MKIKSSFLELIVTLIVAVALFNFYEDIYSNIWYFFNKNPVELAKQPFNGNVVHYFQHYEHINGKPVWLSVVTGLIVLGLISLSVWIYLQIQYSKLKKGVTGNWIYFTKSVNPNNPKYMSGHFTLHFDKRFKASNWFAFDFDSANNLTNQRKIEDEFIYYDRTNDNKLYLLFERFQDYTGIINVKLDSHTEKPTSKKFDQMFQGKFINLDDIVIHNMTTELFQNIQVGKFPKIVLLRVITPKKWWIIPDKLNTKELQTLLTTHLEETKKHID